MSLLDTLKQSIGKLAQPKAKSVLGIDISSSTIRLVQIGRSKGRAILETYGELNLGPYAGIEGARSTSLSPDKLSDALVDLMKEAKTSTIECGVAIPLSSSLINIVQMPDVGESKLKDMVPIEVRKYIPVSIDEVMVDWRIVPQVEMQTREDVERPKEESKVKKVEVLTVAIHKETIDKYTEVIKRAGLRAGFFEVEVFSTIRVALEEEFAPTMIVGLGAGTTKIYIVDRKILRESHIISRGSQEITVTLTKGLGVTLQQAEDMKKRYGVIQQGVGSDVGQISSLVIDAIFSEAQRIMFAYQRKYSRNINRVVLTGGGSIMPGLIDRVRSILQTNVSLAESFNKVETPAFLNDVLKQIGPRFDVAIGAALRRLEELG
jgi:type IV pilus assembly protein PilM